MTTRAATGSSILTDTPAAIGEALDRAVASLGGTPNLAFVFAGPDHDLGACSAELSLRAEGCPVLGCTTAGEFTERGLIHGGVVVLLLAAADAEVALRSVEGLDAWNPAQAEALLSGLPALAEAAGARQRAFATSLLLVDGLCGSGESLVETLRAGTDVFHQIAGGAAGDEGRFAETRVVCDQRQAKNAAAVAHVFSRRRWGMGVGHGLRPASERMTVTRADGNRIFEIDGRPAFDAYRRFARDQGVDLGPDEAPGYMIANELGVFQFGQLARARAPLSVDGDGVLTCAAGIDEGSSICILDGDPDKMLAAVRGAAEESRRALEGDRAAAVLLFDCVCRGMILGDRFQEEIEAVRDVFGDVPVAGFLTYGEIAGYEGKLDGWHNTTAVVVSIPA